jgi:nucleoside-diphosphate-sugar epimerase
MSSEPRCAITGTSGYVGSRVMRYVEARGWSVAELSRRSSGERARGRVHVPYHLEGAPDPAVFRQHGVRALIHCAYDFGPARGADIHRVNVEGSIRLLRAAREGGVERIVFLSSISAFDGCRSLYGRAKLAIERAAFETGASVVRSGLVHGGRSSGGMFGSLQRIASRSSIVPLIGTGAYLQYLAHEEDLCAVLFRLATRDMEGATRPIVAAASRGWPMRDLLQALRPEGSAPLRFVSIPWQAIWVGLKTAETCRIPVPFRSDSVISLVYQDPAPDFSIARRLGFTFRDFAAPVDGAPEAGLTQAARGRS